MFNLNSSELSFEILAKWGRGADKCIMCVSDSVFSLIQSINFAGKTSPFGGGGYFRLYPLGLTQYLFKQLNKQGIPGHFYIHPYEVGPVIPRIKEISPYRKFRHYYNCGKANRIRKLLKSTPFTTARNIIFEKTHA